MRKLLNVRIITAIHAFMSYHAYCQASEVMLFPSEKVSVLLCSCAIVYMCSCVSVQVIISVQLLASTSVQVHVEIKCNSKRKSFQKKIQVCWLTGQGQVQV